MTVCLSRRFRKGFDDLTWLKVNNLGDADTMVDGGGKRKALRA